MGAADAVKQASKGRRFCYLCGLNKEYEKIVSV
jgi:hypothetical protein